MTSSTDNQMTAETGGMTLKDARRLVEGCLSTRGYERAKQLAGHILEQFPRDHQTAVLLARCLLPSDRARAAELLRQAILVDPEDRQLRELLAEVDPTAGADLNDFPPLKAEPGERPT